MSKINRQTRAVWPWLALLAVLVQGLIPAGYMPDFGAAHGGLMPLRICTGDGFATIQVSVDKYGLHKKLVPAGPHQNHAPCDYAINHIFGFANATAPLLVVLLFVLFTLCHISEFNFARRRDFGTIAARAPPALRCT